MKKIVANLFFLALLYFSLPLLMNSVWAGSLTFDKTTSTVANGGTFQVSVNVIPGSDSINSADVYVNYDPALLKATAVNSGVLFPTVSNDISTSGKVYIAGYVDDPASSVSSTGTIATITFQAIKEGTGTLSFDCNTSKIIKNDTDASNVITCSENGTSAVTIGNGSPNGNAPTQLPQSGIFDNVVKFAFPGAILLILGSVIRSIL